MIPEWVGKYAFYLISGAVLVLIAVVWFLWHDHKVAAAAVAPVKAQQVLDHAQADSGHAAVNIVAKTNDQDKTTDASTGKSNAVIVQLPGAKVDLDPALDAAGRRAICLHESAAGLPECQQLLGTHP